MSQIKMETIWQHDKVLPYILQELVPKISAITPVLKIYLFGSRARTPPVKWDKLQGKDWDIAVVCNFRIINTHIWTQDKNYHIDLHVINPDMVAIFLNHESKCIEIYPNNLLII